jgi:hypothetical protein
MEKNKQILTAFIIPLILASLVFFVKYFLLAELFRKPESGVSFGFSHDVANPFEIPTLEYAFNVVCFGLLILSAFLPGLIFLRSEPIERTELNLTNKLI